MKVKGFHINVDELAELLHISIEEYRHRLRTDRLTIRQILALSKYVGFSLVSKVLWTTSLPTSMRKDTT